MAQREYLEKDYYQTLGVSKDASEDEIDKAYRKLARKWHPDINPDDPEAENHFKEISEAHQVLSDPEKRREYDQVREMMSSGQFGGFGPAGGRRTAGAGFPGGGFPGGGFARADGGQTFDLGDLLGEMFGEGGPQGATAGRTGRRRGAGPRRGRDLETDVTLSFEDAMAGVTTTLRISGAAACSRCSGTGARPGTQPRPCPTCGGAGTVASDQGLFSFAEPCPTCGGQGTYIPEPCERCQGSGTEQRTRNVRARIPAGVRDGARIRLKGKGQPGANGGPPGDVYVRVHVEPHDVFDRSGDNLTLHAPLTITEAALGTNITVPTLEDPVTLKIPAGTQPGRTFRVKGRGAPKARGGRGDLLVTADVVVPSKLTKRQRQLLEQLAETEDTDVRAHLRRATREPQEA